MGKPVKSPPQTHGDGTILTRCSQLMIATHGTFETHIETEEVIQDV
jgi:hypothetical protein